MPLAITRSDVVAGAASVLGKLGDKRAVPALVSLLDKNANGTGIVAAEALGYLGDTESVEALIRALNGSDNELQSGAARALGYIGDERAVSSLIEALGSEDFIRAKDRHRRADRNRRTFHSLPLRSPAAQRAGRAFGSSGVFHADGIYSKNT